MFQSKVSIDKVFKSMLKKIKYKMIPRFPKCGVKEGATSKYGKQRDKTQTTNIVTPSMN